MPEDTIPTCVVTPRWRTVKGPNKERYHLKLCFYMSNKGSAKSPPLSPWQESVLLEAAHKCRGDIKKSFLYALEHF